MANFQHPTRAMIDFLTSPEFAEFAASFAGGALTGVALILIVTRPRKAKRKVKHPFIFD